jgi:gliding motility-associated-like protein
VRKIRISEVIPAFTLSDDTICVNGSVLVTNNTSQLPDPVTNYSWNFGDGSSPFIGANPPAHTYNFATYPGTKYTITLSATNMVGCMLPVTHTVFVVAPNTAFGASHSAICVGPTTVTFSAAQGNVGYTLNLGAGITVTSTNNVMTYTFTNPGSYGINLTVQDARGCRATGSPISILAETTPTANFIFSSPRATGDVICAPVPAVSFSDASLPAQTYVYNWNLGTGNPVLQQSVVAQSYNNTTTTVIAISHTVTTPIGCSAAITKTFTIYSPKAQIQLDKSTVCLNDPVKLIIKDTTGSGIKGWVWDYGDGSATGGTILATSGPPSSTLHAYGGYPSSGVYSVSLIYYSAGFACWDADTATINVIKVDADFKRNSELSRIDSVHCLNKTDQFFNNSPAGTSIVSWSFGDGAVSTASNPSHTYQAPGVYQVTLNVSGQLSCKGLTSKNMTINPLPSANISAPDSVCVDSQLQLNGSGTSTAGIITYVWKPGKEVSDSLVAVTTATPKTSTTYSLIVTDGNGCMSPPAVQNVYVQMPPPNIQWDTTVVVGQIVPLNTGTGPNYTYTWTPTTDLSCLNCIQPTSTTTVNVTYSVEVMDNMGCFRVTNTYSIYVDPVTSVDVPTAFTPNGDGVNDVIYVDGWGIKKLNYFKIFNRWGQLLFESYDIKVGWDGYYKGVPQNMETYVYQVSVETYLNKEELVKTSSFRLIR